MKKPFSVTEKGFLFYLSCFFCLLLGVSFVIEIGGNATRRKGGAVLIVKRRLFTKTRKAIRPYRQAWLTTW